MPHSQKLSNNPYHDLIKAMNNNLLYGLTSAYKQAVSGYNNELTPRDIETEGSVPLSKKQ